MKMPPMASVLQGVLATLNSGDDQFSFCPLPAQFQTFLLILQTLFPGSCLLTRVCETDSLLCGRYTRGQYNTISFNGTKSTPADTDATEENIVIVGVGLSAHLRVSLVNLPAVL